MADENTHLLLDSIAKINNPTQNPVNVRLIDTAACNEYLKQKCDDAINKADEKLKTNFEKLELFITVNTFFGGLLLFGLNGTKQKESYKAGEKFIIQLQIVDFCLFLGTIMTAFVFITVTKFRSFKSKSGKLTERNRELYNNSSLIYIDQEKAAVDAAITAAPDEVRKKAIKTNPKTAIVTAYTNKKITNGHNTVFNAAEKEDSLRDQFRKISMLMVALLTLVAIILLVYVVLKGAIYQLDNTKDKKDDSGFDTWVLQLCITFVVVPPLLAIIIIYDFTGRIYEFSND